MENRFRIIGIFDKKGTTETRAVKVLMDCVDVVYEVRNVIIKVKGKAGCVRSGFKASRAEQSRAVVTVVTTQRYFIIKRPKPATKKYLGQRFSLCLLLSLKPLMSMRHTPFHCYYLHPPLFFTALIDFFITALPTAQF